MIVTRNDFKSIMHCEDSDIANWEKKGMPVIQQSGKHKRFDIEACQAWHREGWFNSLSETEQRNLINTKQIRVTEKSPYSAGTEQEPRA